MKFCPECGAKLLSQKFCQECGANVSDYTTSTEEIRKAGGVKFGLYYQNSISVKDPIEWIVLERKCGKALLISKYGIDCKPYNPESIDTTWETAPLRKWLNNDFLNSAFNRMEQKKIQTTRVFTPDGYKVRGGKATTDKIFLLSIEEAEQYFPAYSERVCFPTEYAVSKGAWIDDNRCDWWLRSPGQEQDRAAYIAHAGYVDNYGCDVYGTCCVRPALWVDFEF